MKALQLQYTQAETVINILGFWFYIDWQNNDQGVDQHGNIWKNRESPECVNNRVIDVCLDCFNELIK